MRRANDFRGGAAATALWWSLGAAFAAHAPPLGAQTPSQAPPPPANAAGAAPAKQPTGSAQDEAGEPRANTSADRPAATSGVATPGVATPGVATPGVATPGGAAGAAQSQASKPPSVAPGTSRADKGAPAPKGPAKNDRLDLGLATVTGDQEQPKVLYIVPWKRSDIGDLQGKPMNSLVDEILSPVDRDVFKREVVYYNALQGSASQNGARRPPPAQGEK